MPNVLDDMKLESLTEDWEEFMMVSCVKYKKIYNLISKGQFLNIHTRHTTQRERDYILGSKVFHSGEL